jgi:hypothetical protein
MRINEVYPLQSFENARCEPACLWLYERPKDRRDFLLRNDVGVRADIERDYGRRIVIVVLEAAVAILTRRNRW